MGVAAARWQAAERLNRIVSWLCFRVSLTYRVKSAHKLKLTDQQLLSWMMPIIFVMAVYLGAWTLSAPPHGETILTGTLKFTQCTYNWWDHSLAIGNLLWLLLGFLSSGLIQVGLIGSLDFGPIQASSSS